MVSEVMTDAEKIEKFDQLRDWLWTAAEFGNPLQSTLAAALIRQFGIVSEFGDDPESA